MIAALSNRNLSLERRVPSIDVIRGMAVILVVLHHINLRFQINQYPVSALLPQSVSRVLFWSGYYSVIIFFVISGFLITSLTLKRWGTLSDISPSSFYRLRIARIIPCLLLLLIVLSALHIAGFTDFMINPVRASLPRALIAALTFHVNWLEGTRGYLPGNWDVLWSLSVEETFYLLFPLLCLALRRERWILLAMVALIIVGPVNRMVLDGRDPWSDYAYLSCMDGIAFGCLAAWVSARMHSNKIVLRAALVIGMASVILVIVLRALTVKLGLTNLGLNVTVLELGTALVLYSLTNGVGNSALSNGTAVIQLVGRNSYEIYLTHMFVIFGMMHVFGLVFGDSPHFSAYLIAYASTLVLSIVLGTVVSRWYSEPLNHKFRKHMRLGIK